MDSQYLQLQRFLLQKRHKRLNSCDVDLFHSLFVQFWNCLLQHPLFSGILAALDATEPLLTEEVELARRGKKPGFTTEKEAIAFTFRLLQYMAKQPLSNAKGPEVMLGFAAVSKKDLGDCLDWFRETYLEPFYEYLDEALDGQAAVLSLLLKYKRHVEWFHQEQVRELAQLGERQVAKHLYAYLFDQGLDFQVEPQSISGEADLVSRQLVLDAKVFDGDSSSRGKRYLIHGVNQLLTYLRDFQQHEGYLAIYKTCPEDLQFSFARQGSPVPYLAIDGKVIYFLVIDICQYETSASKRGALKTHELKEEEMRTVISETHPEAPTP